eukprot:TRINITY_DN16690_c0_g1_i1.p1 TRINITY_DN16690_c0_g1~~TRINITY_DN16690_c0_g1_i1.p1  ORF type:complete len:438 (+),score=101.54 TRINITY_DN16690_c0_g1_i1:49-1362(+)
MDDTSDDSDTSILPTEEYTPKIEDEFKHKSKDDLTSVCDRKKMREAVLSTSSNKPTGGGSSAATRRKTTNRSSASSIPSVYSSTDSDSRATQEIQKKPIRRRRQKRKARQNSSVTKAVEIESALATGDRDKLVQLSVSQLGLCNDKMRARVWPVLMNVDHLEDEDNVPTDEQVQKHPEYNQVVLDVNRSLKRFPPCIGEEERPLLQEQLTRLIIRVIITHPHLHYYQGYHDVAITFLLVVGEHLGYHIVERLSVSHLKEFMAPTMEPTSKLLQYMYPIIRQRNSDLHSHMVRAEVGTIFALPWLITWFGHVLPDYNDVVRLYDFFLAQPPMMPVYLATAIVLYRQQEILEAECEMSSIHGLLSQIPQDLPFEKLLVESQILYEYYPPHSVKVEAETGAVPSSYSSVANNFSTSVTKFIIYTAPVFLGIIIFKYYFQS